MANKIYKTFQKNIELDNNLKILSDKELKELEKIDKPSLNLIKKNIILTSNWVYPDVYEYQEYGEYQLFFKRFEFNFGKFPLYLIPFIKIVSMVESDEEGFINYMDFKIIVEQLGENEDIDKAIKPIKIIIDVYPLNDQDKIKVLLMITNPREFR